MENIVIRDYKSEDYLAIIDLWLKTGYGKTCRYENQKVIEKTIKMGGRLIVATAPEGVMAGSLWLTFDGHSVHLHHLCVMPKFIEMEIMRFLVGEAIRFCKGKGYQLKIEAGLTNKAMINHLTEMGFTSIGEYFIFVLQDYTND